MYRNSAALNHVRNLAETVSHKQGTCCPSAIVQQPPPSLPVMHILAVAIGNDNSATSKISPVVHLHCKGERP